MRKSVVNQSEIAFVAYIQAIIAGTVPPPAENPTANTILAGTLPAFPMTVYAFQQVYGVANPNPGQSATPENISTPDIMFQGGKPTQIAYDCGIYSLPFTVFIETQVDDEQLPNAPVDTHHSRVEALRDCLEDFTQVSAYINAPASGMDTRTVKSFTLSSIVYQDELEELKDRRFITAIYYDIEACPQDAPTS